MILIVREELVIGLLLFDYTMSAAYVKRAAPLHSLRAETKGLHFSDDSECNAYYQRFVPLLPLTPTFIYCLEFCAAVCLLCEAL